MVAELKPSGFALLCHQTGIIEKVIANHFGSALQIEEGKPFTSLLSERSFRQGLSFLADIAQQQALYDRPMQIMLNGEIQSMQFTGSMTDQGMLIIGILHAEEFEKFFTELTKINNEQSTLIRKLTKNIEQDQRGTEARIYEDFSKLNNELANLQRELTKKNQQLERLNEQKNELLGMAAHDLRNPLGVIMGYAKFLAATTQDRLDTNEMNFLTQITSSSEFMLKLLENLLDVSQIEAGKLTLQKSATDLNQLIRGNIALQKPLAAQKNIDICVSGPAAPLLVSIDQTKIEQVLNNLISNAIKYSHSDTTIQVLIEPQAEQVRIHIQDQGQGIPAEELTKLFKSFSKTSVKSTGGEKSTGLGLVITKNIVEGHGGHIWVESTPSIGSIFSFSLPCST